MKGPPQGSAVATLVAGVRATAEAARRAQAMPLAAATSPLARAGAGPVSAGDVLGDVSERVRLDWRQAESCGALWHWRDWLLTRLYEGGEGAIAQPLSRANSVGEAAAALRALADALAARGDAAAIAAAADAAARLGESFDMLQRLETARVEARADAIAAHMAGGQDRAREGTPRP